MFLARPLLLVVLCWITACAQQNPLAPSQARTAIPTLIDQSSGKPEPAGLPFYARLERTFQPIHSDEWAAIVFYRQPSCVPSGFNLLDFLDIPRVFGCPLTVDGFQIWKDPFPALPIQVNIAGLGAVPIWFVSWVELQAAMADDLVTIGELQGLNSLVVGSANSVPRTPSSRRRTRRGRPRRAGGWPTVQHRIHIRWRSYAALENRIRLNEVARLDRTPRASGPQPHPSFIEFLVRLPSVEARGRWRERGRMQRR